MFVPIVAFVGTVQLDAQRLRCHTDRIREAIHKSYPCGMKDACAAMNIDQGQFVRQLSGEGHISFTRLAMLSNEFHQELAISTLYDYGLPRWLAKAGMLALAMGTRRQPLQMDEPQADRRMA